MEKKLNSKIIPGHFVQIFELFVIDENTFITYLHIVITLYRFLSLQKGSDLPKQRTCKNHKPFLSFTSLEQYYCFLMAFDALYLPVQIILFAHSS